MGRKVCLRCKGKTLLGVENKLLKKPFPRIIFTEGEGDGIEYRLSSSIFSTLFRENVCDKNKNDNTS